MSAVIEVLEAATESPRPVASERPAPKTPRKSGPLRLLRLFLGWTAVGAVSGMLVLLTIPSLFGFHNFIEMSGSMDPTLRVGDIVVSRSVAPLDVRVGDVITFRDPQDQSKLVTHRVHDMHVRDGSVRFTTKGDAVNSVQSWNIPFDGHVGRVVTHIPWLGFAVFWVATRIGRLLLIVIPAGSLGLMELLRIWRPRKKTARESAA